MPPPPRSPAPSSGDVPISSISGEAGRPALETEWVLATGTSGYAMGCASGVPMRRYHALLVAPAAGPDGPPGRFALLTGLHDQLVVTGEDGRREAFPLCSFDFAATGVGGGAIRHPDGVARLVKFEKDIGCRWVYRAGRYTVTRRLVLADAGAGVGEAGGAAGAGDTAIVEYSIDCEEGSLLSDRLVIEARPLVSLRDHHELLRHGAADPSVRHDGDSLRISRDRLALTLTVGRAEIEADAHWWYNFLYEMDRARGQDCVEDLYSPCLIRWDITESRSATLIASAGDRMSQPINADEEIARRRGRLVSMAKFARRGLADQEMAEAVERLACAADDFIFHPRSAGGTRASIIAGYPWFSDWGRDAMISLPGLLLETGRHEEAFSILGRFAAATRRGLVPNLFDDHTGEPHYNTADASLWFIITACRYLDASGDRARFDSTLLPACLGIIEWYRRGTDYSIAVDPDDQLIAAGTPVTQLTWMDAARGGVVFTPRHGKPVELSALWISGLGMLAAAIERTRPTAAADFRMLAARASASFRQLFWNEAAGCCYDCLAPGERSGAWTPVGEIRPNQILAVSLPGSPLSHAQQLTVVATVERELLTPGGLRTLSPRDPKYRGRYDGDLMSRDGAYHNGTAWPWPLGSFAEAIVRVEGHGADARSEGLTGGFSDASRDRAWGVLRPLVMSLPSRLGHLSEVFDGDSRPARAQQPSGCPAQAWSIAEMLRAIRLIAGNRTTAAPIGSASGPRAGVAAPARP